MHTGNLQTETDLSLVHKPPTVSYITGNQTTLNEFLCDHHFFSNALCFLGNSKPTEDPYNKVPVTPISEMPNSVDFDTQVVFGWKFDDINVYFEVNYLLPECVGYTSSD